MRTVFTVGLLASLVGLLCTEEASACWRRHRHRCCSASAVCSPCEQYPVCAQEHIVYASVCQCTGINSCQISCPGPCYGMKDGSGHCHCGCATSGLIPSYKIGANERITFQSQGGLTIGHLNQLLRLDLDHGAIIQASELGTKLRPIHKTGTIAELMDDVGIKHKPPKP